MTAAEAKFIWTQIVEAYDSFDISVMYSARKTFVKPN